QNGSTSNEWYGITSYGGNAGSQSHPFSAVTSDGIFFYTGPAAPGFSQVRISGVTDGLSNTLFFGERNHFDPNYDTFAPPGWTFFSQTMGICGAGGRPPAAATACPTWRRAPTPRSTIKFP